MKPTRTIKMDGTGFNPVFVHSFASEKEFLAATDGKYFPDKDKKTRTAMLKQVYKLAKATKDIPIEEEEG